MTQMSRPVLSLKPSVRMRERVTVLGLSVSHSVTKQKANFQNGGFPKIDQNVTLDNLSLLMCQNFSSRLIFSEKASYFFGHTKPFVGNALY